MSLLTGVGGALQRVVSHTLWYLDWRTGGDAVRDAAPS
jgi:hypothetical protein